MPQKVYSHEELFGADDEQKVYSHKELFGEDDVQPERGFLGDTASHLARGVVGLGETTARAVETVTGSETAKKAGDYLRDLPDQTKLLQPDESEAIGEEGAIKKGWNTAIESTPESLAILPATIAGAEAGAALGSVVPGVGTVAGGIVGGVAGGGAALLALFGAGTYGKQKSYVKERLEKERPELSKDQINTMAHENALTHAYSEVGGEGAGDLAAYLVFSRIPGGKAAYKGGKAILKELVNPNALKAIGKGLLKDAPFEVGSEMGTSYFQNKADKKIGIADQSTLAAMGDAIIPALFMSTGMGVVVGGRSAWKRKQAYDRLNVGSADERLQYAKAVSQSLKEATSKDVAKKWYDTAVSYISSGDAIPLDSNVADLAANEGKPDAQEVRQEAPKPPPGPATKIVSQAKSTVETVISNDELFNNIADTQVNVQDQADTMVRRRGFDTLKEQAANKPAIDERKTLKITPREFRTLEHFRDVLTKSPEDQQKAINSATSTEAQKIVSRLEAKGLIKKEDNGGYTPIPVGGQPFTMKEVTNERKRFSEQSTGVRPISTNTNTGGQGNNSKPKKVQGITAKENNGIPKKVQRIEGKNRSGNVREDKKGIPGVNLTADEKSFLSSLEKGKVIPNKKNKPIYDSLVKKGLAKTDGKIYEVSQQATGQVTKNDARRNDGSDGIVPVGTDAGKKSSTKTGKVTPKDQKSSPKTAKNGQNSKNNAVKGDNSELKTEKVKPETSKSGDKKTQLAEQIDEQIPPSITKQPTKPGVVAAKKLDNSADKSGGASQGASIQEKPRRKVKNVFYKSYKGEKLTAKSFLEYRGYKIIKEHDKLFNVVDNKNNTVSQMAGIRGAVKSIDKKVTPDKVEWVHPTRKELSLEWEQENMDGIWFSGYPTKTEKSRYKKHFLDNIDSFTKVEKIAPKEIEGQLYTTESVEQLSKDIKHMDKDVSVVNESVLTGKATMPLFIRDNGKLKIVGGRTRASLALMNGGEIQGLVLDRQEMEKAFYPVKKEDFVKKGRGISAFDSVRTRKALIAYFEGKRKTPPSLKAFEGKDKAKEKAEIAKIKEYLAVPASKQDTAEKNSAKAKKKYSKSILPIEKQANVKQEIVAEKGRPFLNRLLRNDLVEIVNPAEGEEVLAQLGVEAKYMVAWHGSPHSFDKFSTDNIGTGEGAQAYGHGLYFAGNKEVAEYYRDTLSQDYLKPVESFSINGKTYKFDSAEGHALNLLKNGGKRQALSTAKEMFVDAKDEEPYTQEHGKGEKHYQSLYEFVLNFNAKDTGKIKENREDGHLYKVDLAPKESEYLLWDRPLSEQSESVMKALGLESAIVYAKFDRFRESLISKYGKKFWDDGLATKEERGKFNKLMPAFDKSLTKKGSQFYNILSEKFSQGDKSAMKLAVEMGHDPYSGEFGAIPADKLASDYLHSLGVRGIKYLDGSSRSKGEGNYNYVIFDENDVNIDVKYSADGQQIEGFTARDPKTGKTKSWIIEGNVKKGEAHKLLLHETASHLMLEGKFQGKDWDNIVSQFHKFADKNSVTGKAIRAAKARVPKSTNPEHVDQEMIAYYMGDSANRDQSLYRKVVAYIKEKLVELGFSAKMFTPEDIEVIAKRLLTRAYSPETQGSINVKKSEKLDKKANLKEWFGKSKVKQFVYHGSSTFGKGDNFTFDNSRETKTTSPMRGLGYFFAEEESDARGYAGADGQTEKIILRIENPFEVNSWEIPTFNDTTEAKAYSKRKELDGYDGIHIKDEGHWITFKPNQSKSATKNIGSYSRSNDDIRYSVAAEVFDERNPPPIGKKETPFEINRKVNGNIKKKALRNIKATFRDVVGGIDKFLGTTSTRLKNIHPKIEAKYRKLDFETGTKLKRDIYAVKPLLDKAKKMSKDDFADWDFARKNSVKSKIAELVKKYNMVDEYKSHREALNRIRDEANHVGMDVKWLKDYAPRVIKDPQGFLEAVGTEGERKIISDAIQARADKMGISVAAMPIEMKADIVSNMLFGGYSGVGSSPHTKERTIDVIPPELNQYYMDSDGALMHYLHSMRKHIEIRNFFGKLPTVIANAKSAMRQAESRLRKAKVKEEEKIMEQDPFHKKGAYLKPTKQMESIQETIDQYRNILDKYKTERDYSDNIGEYIIELINDGTIKTAADEKTIFDILRARFHEVGTRGTIQKYKNVSYVDTMGSPISAITQIGDLAWTVYENGLVRSMKNAYKSATNKSRITKEDVGIERIAQEFADTDTLSKAVAKVFKWVGLEKMDTIGTESFLNSSLEKYEEMAAKKPKALRSKVKDIFEGETDNLIEDLKNKRITDNVKLLVYSNLLDFQPKALSEMSEQYLMAGNGRVFYMLKSYTLKQFDVFRREAYNDLKNGNKKEKIEAMKRLVHLSSLIVLANAGADEIKDFLLGRDTSLEDRVVDNILRLFGVSKYVTWKARTEGVGSALVKQILPPFKFIDSLSKDITSAGDEKGLNVMSSVPFFGKLAYWHMGRGKHKFSDYADRRFSEERKRLQKISDKVSKNNVLATKYRKETIRLGRMKRVQRGLRRYRKQINRLKRIEKRTGNDLSSRIYTLEKARVALIDKFLNRQ